MVRGTEVDRYKGFIIRYEADIQKFHAYDPENRLLLSADTQKELERKIDVHLKTQFQPFEAIDVSNERLVKVTSRDPMDPARQVWISFKQEDGTLARAKEYLRDWEHNPKFYKTTPENLVIWRQIEDKRILMSQLQADINELKKKFTEPVLYDVPASPP